MQNIMRTIIKIIFVAVAVLAVSCNKSYEIPNPSESREYYDGDVKITIIRGCPFDTRATSENYESFTVTAVKDDISATMYVIDNPTDAGITFSDTYLEDGTKVATAAIFNGEIVTYELSPEIQAAVNESMATGKLGSWWGKYRDCVFREADKMSEQIGDHAVARALCEWGPCETVSLIRAAIICVGSK